MVINYVYALGFIKESAFYGGVIIFSEKAIDDDDVNIIETISNQASLSIHKRTIEKELRISEYRFRKLSSELEESVKIRTKDLNYANSQLKKELNERILTQEALKESESQLRELNATKDKFLNIVAHDLKNPFTSLLGASELLFDNTLQMNTDSIKNLALILNDSAKSGYAILQNLLDWSRSQTGMLKINPERIRLKNLMDENILNLKLFSTNKEIVIQSIVKDDLIVYTDKNMLNTIIRNLVSNAIKFSYRGGKVFIRIGYDSGELIVKIKDNGVVRLQLSTRKVKKIRSV